MENHPYNPDQQNQWNQQWNQQQYNNPNQQHYQQQYQQQYQQHYQQPYNPHFPPYNPFVHTNLELPNAQTAQICGIIGIVMFWNIIGIICNIVAIVSGGNAKREYLNAPPGKYREDGFSKANTGKVCGIIGLSLLGVCIVLLLVIVALNT